MVRFALISWLVLVTGCVTGRSPELRVLGVHDAPATESHVFVQVTNPASRPMRLTKLEYVFASSKGTVSQGEVPLAREIPAGAAVVVEVPLESERAEALTLQGQLTTELDQIVRIFKVSAQIQPH